MEEECKITEVKGYLQIAKKMGVFSKTLQKEVLTNHDSLPLLAERMERNKQMKNCTTTDSLPQEIISEILQRVPALALIRLKTVSKLWFNLLSDRNFMKAHAYRHHHQQQPTLSRQPWIIFNTHPSCRSYCFFFDLEENSMRGKEFQLLLQDRIKDMFLVIASCNGLVLTQSKLDKKKLYVSNPVTGRYLMLPSPMGRFSRWTLIHDASIEKYKVIGISDCNRCFVCVLGMSIHCHEGGWRELAVGPSKPGVSQLVLSQLLFVDRMLYWMVEELELRQFYSMDIAREEFKGTQGPPWQRHSGYNGLKYQWASLLELNGSLYFIDPVSKIEIDIWVLSKDCDEEERVWNKEHRIVFEPLYDSRPLTPMIQRERLREIFRAYESKVFMTNAFPFAAFAEGHGNSGTAAISQCQTKILIHFQRKFFCYDSKNQEVKHITGINIEDFEPGHQPLVLYTHSFVSWD